LDYSQFDFSPMTITLAFTGEGGQLDGIIEHLATGDFGPATWAGIYRLSRGCDKAEFSIKETDEIALWRITYGERSDKLLLINFRNCMDKAVLFKTRFCSTPGEWILPIICRHCGIVDHAKNITNTLPNNNTFFKI
jgi:hypothetical protein